MLFSELLYPHIVWKWHCIFLSSSNELQQYPIHL